MAKKSNSTQGYLIAIGANIRNHRQKSGFTLEMLGDKIGLDKGNMHKIESGKNVTILTLIKIAELLDVAPGKLLEAKASKSAPKKKSSGSKGKKKAGKKK